MYNNRMAALIVTGVLAGVCTTTTGWSAPQIGRGGGDFRAERSRRSSIEHKTKPWREPTWESVTYGILDPRTICSAVKRRIMYVRDRKPDDEWKSARKTWSDRRGDCEDFAVLVKRLCEQRNMQAEVYHFYPPKGSGHAVTIGKWRGRLWMSSNGSFTKVLSINDARRQVAHSQGWAAQSVQVSKGENARRATI